MSNELTELEKLAVKVSEGIGYNFSQVSKIINKLTEEGKKITERTKPKPMFPIEEGFIVGWDGWVGEVDKDAYSNFATRFAIYEKAARGNTAYTREEAKRLDDRNLARVRVLEKIYAANGYKVRGFIEGALNYYAYYNHTSQEIRFKMFSIIQYLPDEFYFSEEVSKTLKKDEDFKRDVAIWLGCE